MINKDKFIYIEWVVTFGCNYSCSYCFFRDNLQKNAYMYKNRGPRMPKNIVEKWIFSILRSVGVFHFADSFKNYDVSKWLAMFAEISKTKKHLTLSFTGGEPLINHKILQEIIFHLEKCFEELVIRIDTNGSVVPSFDDSIKKYISYNVSYHPSQTTIEKMLKSLKMLDGQGAVSMVNRVISKDELIDIDKEIEYFSNHGYYLNINPTHFDIAQFNDNEINVLKKYKCKIDFDNSLLNESVGKKCIYPKFGLQLLPSGFAWIPPCDSKTTVNLLAKPSRLSKLLKNDALVCPSKCVCFHQYPWTKSGYVDMNIMREYVERNKQHRYNVN